MERFALNAQRGDNFRVHWMAFGVIVLGYVMAFVFARMDMQTLAGIVLTTTIIGTITGFLQSKLAARKPKPLSDDDDGDDDQE